MQSKFLKTILMIGIIAVVIISVTYLVRTVIDIGCAKTGIGEDSLKRRFIGINCWFWEETFQLQDEININ